MNKGVLVLGVQWGDEGKGKVVDLLINRDVKYVVRYQGGDNAGHTLCVNSKKVILHVIPSGILHDHIINIIANGVVISPLNLIYEMNLLKSSGIDVSGRILISKSCSMILPYHIAIDEAREKFKNNNDVIGTTGRGIGPAYEDKVARRAIRVVDLYNKVRFSRLLKQNVDYYNFQLSNYYDVDIVDYEQILSDILSVSDCLLDMAIDTCDFLNCARKRGDLVIFEGAQGALLDVDHGTYPYVTSSNTISGAVSSGAGVVLNGYDYVLGVLKSYATRVGFGPFPTELFDDIGEFLRIGGNEFGSTTGRCRRTGWFDAVTVRRSVQINDFSGIFLTKLDVLDGLEEVKICVGYRFRDGTVVDVIPVFLEEWESIEPVYEVFSGWCKASTLGIRDFNKLPEAARNYVKRIEEIIDVPIDMISTGPDRNEVIVIRHPLY